MQEIYFDNAATTKVLESSAKIAYDIMISDFAVYGMMSAEKNETIDGANSKLAMAESSFETYKLLIESALNGKRIYCNATQDTSYQNIKRMMEKGLAQVKDFNFKI